jgi:hypothetical protein
MQFLVVLVLNSLLGTIAARRCLSQTVPTAGDPGSPEQAHNEPTQKNAGHARIFGFPIEPVGSLTICTAYGTPDDSVAPNPSSGRSQLSVTCTPSCSFASGVLFCPRRMAHHRIKRCRSHLSVLPASRATGGIIGFSALQRILLQNGCTPDHRGIPLE